MIVSTALHILERDGLSGLSLRRVATALNTGAASLYVYVANLEELHALMLDHALSAMQGPKPAVSPGATGSKLSFWRIFMSSTNDADWLNSLCRQ